VKRASSALKALGEGAKAFRACVRRRQASQLRESLRAVVASDLGPFDTTVAD